MDEHQIEIENIIDELQTLCWPVNNNVHSYLDLLQDLSYHINYLITNNFNKLIALLYRLDVSEEQLRNLLKQHTDKLASDSIAKLIIERQQMKMRMKTSFKKDENIPEDEKW